MGFAAVPTADIVDPRMITINLDLSRKAKVAPASMVSFGPSPPLAMPAAARSPFV